MKILQLCKKFPYPIKDGESIAVNSLSKALHTMDVEMTLLAMNTEKHYSKVPLICSELAHYKAVHQIYVDNTLKPIDALTNLINGKSYHISRFVSHDFRNKLIELLQNEHFDIVQLETSYMSLYLSTIREYSDAKIVLRSHNHEYEIWERMASSPSYSKLKKWYLRNCADRLYKFEKNRLSDYDMIVGITEQDSRKYIELEPKVKTFPSPTGLDLEKYKPQSLNELTSIGFIGSLDWMPNIEGLKWFLENVWSDVTKRYPDLKFHIAGRNIDPEIKAKNYHNVIIEGEVECALKFISSHNIMLVPLFAGSGLRIKILEGMALGRTIISTTVGAEGLEVENGEHLLLADTKKQFLEAINFCMEHPEMMIEIGRQARKQAKAKYSNFDNAEKLLEKYKALVKYPIMTKLHPKNHNLSKSN